MEASIQWLYHCSGLRCGGFGNIYMGFGHQEEKVGEWRQDITVR